MTRSRNHMVLLRFLICALALVGLADSLYFTLAYYGRIRKARWIPEILCAREGSACVTVVQTPYARLFGVPNSLLGIVYYVLLIAGAMENWTFGVNLDFHFARVFVPFGMAILILIGAGTILVGFYLIYALRCKLHIDCPLCYTAHAINVAIFVLLIVLAT
ncbi:MAG: vitamin K epoxide reductase family protein [Terriglobia bacterium]